MPSIICSLWYFTLTMNAGSCCVWLAESFTSLNSSKTARICRCQMFQSWEKNIVFTSKTIISTINNRTVAIHPLHKQLFCFHPPVSGYETIWAFWKCLQLLYRLEHCIYCCQTVLIFIFFHLSHALCSLFSLMCLILSACCPNLPFYSVGGGPLTCLPA